MTVFLANFMNGYAAQKISHKRATSSVV